MFSSASAMSCFLAGGISASQTATVMGTDGGIMITGGLDFIEHLGGDGGAVNLDAAVDDLAEHTLAYLLGDGLPCSSKEKLISRSSS